MSYLRRLCRWFASWDTAVMVGLGLIVVGVVLFMALGCASVKVEPAKAESSKQLDGAWSRTRVILPPKGEVCK